MERAQDGQPTPDSNRELSSKQRGKQRVAPQEDGADDVTQAAVQESQWRAGVNRQSLPAAHKHQLAASQAAAAKRTANAMPPAERKAKRAAARRKVTAQKAAERIAAAGAARAEAAAARVPTCKQLNRWLKEEGQDESCNRDEWDAFEDYIAIVQDVDCFDDLEDNELTQAPFIELFNDWRASDEYREYTIDKEINQMDYEHLQHSEQELSSDACSNWGSEGSPPPDDADNTGWANVCFGNPSPPQMRPPPPAPPPPPPPPPPQPQQQLYSVPQGLHAAGTPMAMPLAEFEAVLQQMTKEHLQQRKADINTFTDAWWLSRDRPEQPWLFDEFYAIGKEVSRRYENEKKCRECGYLHCSCELPAPQLQHQRLPHGMNIDDVRDRQEELELRHREDLAVSDRSRRERAIALSTPSLHEQRMLREQAAGPPPRREHSTYGARGDIEGDESFRADRVLWYEHFTGDSIQGLSLTEQWEAVDVVARRFRPYSDGRVRRI